VAQSGTPKQPVVMFTDVEAWVCGWLRDQLAARPGPYARGGYVSNQVPSPRTERMVLIRRDGETRLDVVREAARLGVQVWASADAEVADLTGLVRGLLAANVGEGSVRGYSETVGPITVPDPSGQSLRYFTAELIARAL
jgi:hypothetical protein